MEKIKNTDSALVAECEEYLQILNEMKDRLHNEIWYIDKFNDAAGRKIKDKARDMIKQPEGDLPLSIARSLFYWSFCDFSHFLSRSKTALEAKMFIDKAAAIIHRISKECTEVNTK